MTLQVGQSTQIEHLPSLPAEVEGDGNNGTQRLLHPRESPQLLEGSHRFPASSIRPLSPVCRSEAIHSTLTCITGVTACRISVYLSLLMGGSEGTVVLHLRHLGPPTWVALNLV